jgi:hypothetical protein
VETLSRIQCTIGFALGRWTIIDGDGQRTSTNGTWLYLGSPTKIESGMILKLGPNLLKAKVVTEEATNETSG